MTRFRDMLAHDNVNTFLNLEEFGEYHKVAGNTVRCVVDDDINERESGARDMGITDMTFTLFVRSTEVDKQLEGSMLEFDGRLYTVDAWRTDEGMHEITLRKVTGY